MAEHDPETHALADEDVGHSIRKDDLEQQVNSWMVNMMFAMLVGKAKTKAKQLADEARNSFVVKVLLGLLALLVTFQVVNIISGDKLHDLELKPRDFPLGFIGLVISPLVDENFTMLVFNSIPFSVQAAYIMSKYGTQLFTLLTLIGAGMGGAITWVIAREHAHFHGLAPLVFTYGFYLMLRAFFATDSREVVLGASCVAFTIIFTALFSPNPTEIAWEGLSVCGLLGAGYGYLSKPEEMLDIVWNKVPDDISCEDAEDEPLADEEDVL
eukprot:CAMPEP_0197526306 /NCGR_PEP_ID=MMETSP1318-20131121/17257_1 /TAXON_ID=552666 /ORGANISM="Partenskyella glossopodia, Strain RCC365" /LENGTH=268 /DNA_ID=CAMNT_0043080411 /DNA_START=47 /DNA_END=853 /DNA_ORIENTATION=-